MMRCLMLCLCLTSQCNLQCHGMLYTCLGRGKTPKLLGPRRRTCFNSAAIIFFPSPCLCILNGLELTLTALKADLAPGMHGQVLIFIYLMLTVHKLGFICL
jgi:hypothetical protein